MVIKSILNNYCDALSLLYNLWEKKLYLIGIGLIQSNKHGDSANKDR